MLILTGNQMKDMVVTFVKGTQAQKGLMDGEKMYYGYVVDAIKKLLYALERMKLYPFVSDKKKSVPVYVKAGQKLEGADNYHYKLL